MHVSVFMSLEHICTKLKEERKMTSIILPLLLLLLTIVYTIMLM